MSEVEYWAIDLDEWTEEVWDWLERRQDGRAGHYAAYEGTREEAVEKCVGVLRSLVQKMLYESDDYGNPIEWKDEPQ